MSAGDRPVQRIRTRRVVIAKHVFARLTRIAGPARSAGKTMARASVCRSIFVSVGRPPASLPREALAAPYSSRAGLARARRIALERRVGIRSTTAAGDFVPDNVRMENRVAGEIRTVRQGRSARSTEEPSLVWVRGFLSAGRRRVAPTLNTEHAVSQTPYAARYAYRTAMPKRHTCRMSFTAPVAVVWIQSRVCCVPTRAQRMNSVTRMAPASRRPFRELTFLTQCRLNRQAGLAQFQPSSMSTPSVERSIRSHFRHLRALVA
jgi:hypothetical protein